MYDTSHLSLCIVHSRIVRVFVIYFNFIEMQFVKSAKDNNLLINDGFLYSREKIPTNEKTMWKCVENKNGSLKCCAKVQIVKVLRVHSHPPDPAKIKSKEIHANIKQSTNIGLSTHLPLLQKVTNILHREFLIYIRYA